MTLVRRPQTIFPAWFDDFCNREVFNADFAKGLNVPAVNIRETSDAYAVEVAAPGLSKEDFKIQVENGMLTISSQKEQKAEVNDEKGKYTRKEFSYSSFSRTFTLPEKTVDTEKIGAKYADGILFITIPKKDEVKVKSPKMIQIA